jgi:hypothetical protein
MKGSDPEEKKHPMSPPLKLNRRSFLFAFGGTILGTFAVPATLAQAMLEPGSADAAMELPLPDPGRDDAEPILRRVIGRVLWNEEPQPHLLWVERFEDEHGTPEPKVMLWVPDTEEELAEARRFYEASCWKSYRSFEELSSRPRQPGRYIVRWWSQNGYFSYLRSLDEERLFPSPDDGPECWCLTPEEAVVMTHDKAIEMTIRLMKAYGFDIAEADVMYLEPILLEEAITSHRRLAR